MEEADGLPAKLKRSNSWTIRDEEELSLVPGSRVLLLLLGGGGGPLLLRSTSYLE